MISNDRQNYLQNWTQNTRITKARRAIILWLSSVILQISSNTNYIDSAVTASRRLNLWSDAFTMTHEQLKAFLEMVNVDTSHQPSRKTKSSWKYSISRNQHWHLNGTMQICIVWAAQANQSLISTLAIKQRHDTSNKTTECVIKDTTGKELSPIEDWPDTQVPRIC